MDKVVMVKIPHPFRIYNLLLILIPALTLACGGSKQNCVPGATQPCHCMGGGAGVQICSSAGTGWEACNCTVQADGGPAQDGGPMEDGGPAQDGGPIPDGGLGLGSPCTDPTQCGSGHCKDAVCCDSACLTPCTACNLSGYKGTCKLVKGMDDDPECTGPKTCDPTGNCRLKVGNDCLSGGDCASGHCKDSFCCDTACGDTCKACNLPNFMGACTTVTSAEDPDTCSQDNICNLSGECRIKAGAACSQNTECITGHCKADFDGTGKWCTDLTQCAHDGTIHENGLFAQDCSTGESRASCNEGTWVPLDCGTDLCRGDCGSSANGCNFISMICQSGSCGENTHDPDEGQAFCTGCALAWNLGGEVAANACCGDDLNEYARSCDEAPSTGVCNASVTACCDMKIDCLDHDGTCLAGGACHEAGSANKKIYCDAGTWRDPDGNSAHCTASGCGFNWLSHAGASGTCCGDDPGEDWEQAPGTGRSCCYNGTLLTSGASSASILCHDGQLYNCNNAIEDHGGLATHKDTCEQVGSHFCSTENTWTFKKSNSCSCTTTGECQSNQCSDGICCNTACDQPCWACNVSGKEGTCTQLKSQDDPPECSITKTCSATGACKLKTGQTSTDPAACVSGYAKDGYCCDQACDQPCWACNVSGKEGTCTQLKSQDDPPECAATKTCDALGSCKLLKGQTCTTPGQCLSGFCKDQVCCDNACTEPCQACNLTNSVGSCTAVESREDQTECQGDTSCDASGNCMLKLGKYCTGSNDECLSGHCIDNYCCNTVCDGTCWACNLNGKLGTCSKVLGGEDSDTCTGEYTCDGTGACLLKQGSACTGGGSTCITGLCVDGRCCDTACERLCQACNLTNTLGTCTSIVSAPDPSLCEGTMGCNAGGVCTGRISFDPKDSRRPALAWSGSEYGLSWTDRRDAGAGTYFCRLGPDGAKVGPERQIGQGIDGAMIWTGSNYAIVNTKQPTGHYQVYFARLAANGDTLVNETQVSNITQRSDLPDIVWTGSEYGVAWQDWWATSPNMYAIYFARVNESGQRLTDAVQLDIGAPFKRNASLGWTGSGFNVCWQERKYGYQYELAMARLDALGVEQGTEHRLTHDTDEDILPDLVWTGSEYGMCWDDGRHGSGEIYFARLDAQGTQLATENRISFGIQVSTNPALVWTGSEFGVAYEDRRMGYYEIYFSRISPTGVPIGQEVRISWNEADSQQPTLTWTGSEYGVSWKDKRDEGEGEIYFGRYKP